MSETAVCCCDPHFTHKNKLGLSVSQKFSGCWHNLYLKNSGKKQSLKYPMIFRLKAPHDTHLHVLILYLSCRILIELCCTSKKQHRSLSKKKIQFNSLNHKMISSSDPLENVTDYRSGRLRVPKMFNKTTLDEGKQIKSRGKLWWNETRAPSSDLSWAHRRPEKTLLSGVVRMTAEWPSWVDTAASTDGGTGQSFISPPPKSRRGQRSSSVVTWDYSKEPGHLETCDTRWDFSEAVTPWLFSWYPGEGCRVYSKGFAEWTKMPHFN